MSLRACLTAVLALACLVGFSGVPFDADAAGATTKKAVKAEPRKAARKAAGIEQVAVGLGPALDAPTKCLALSIYWEGRSEIEAGQAAIAHTVLNRTRDGKFPRGVCGVITEGDNDGKRGCQFAWWCDGKSDEPNNPAQWSAAVQTARQALSGKLADPTGGALYFHGDNDNPSWSKARQRLTRIGNHVFYR